MHIVRACAALLIISVGGIAGAQEANPKLEGTTHKPRVIHTTDLGPDPDDEQSLVRHLEDYLNRLASRPTPN